MNKRWLPWLILSPSLLFLLLFTWFPLGRSVYDSLFDTRMASDGAQYVGLDNFARLFADGVFWQSLVNNLLYILLTVVPGVTLALLLAVALLAWIGAWLCWRWWRAGKQQDWATPYLTTQRLRWLAPLGFILGAGSLIAIQFHPMMPIFRQLLVKVFIG